MGSRFGSIAILVIIAAIIGAAGVIIYRLGLLGGDDADQRPVVVSIEDGALILLGEPQNITVRVVSGTPITTLKLVVDEDLRAEAIPVYSAERGSYIGSLVWTPQQLGFADLEIIAIDEQGRESTRTLRVEVTDDDARIAAALRLEVLGLAPNQQLIAGETVRIALRASGAQAIARFEMEVDGNLEATIAPTLGESGAYVASINWTPLGTGLTEVVFRVFDAADRTETRVLQVNILASGSVPGATSTDSADDRQSGGGADGTTPEGGDSGSSDAASGDGVALIARPQDGDDFRLTPDLTVDVELHTRNTGPLASVLLYVTPVGVDGTLGASILIFSAADSLPPGGEYRETVAGLERWLTAPGRYELQLVVFAADERRFDHRISIAVIADGGQPDAQDDEETDSTQSDEETDDTDDPDADDETDIDLALTSARQREQDRGRVNVAIANLSPAAVESVRVQLSLVDSRDGAILNESRVRLSLGAGETANIPLDFTIERDVNALVVLESSIDSDTSNNTLQIELRAPEPEPEDEQQQEQAEQAEQEAAQEQEEPEAEVEPEAQQPLPDLAFQEVVFNRDGFALITIVNQGAAPVSTVAIALLGPDGTEVERINRSPNAQPLPPSGAEILVSSASYDQPLTLVLDPDDEVDEADETNNRTTADPSQ